MNSTAAERAAHHAAEAERCLEGSASQGKGFGRQETGHKVQALLTRAGAHASLAIYWQGQGEK